MKKIYHRSLYTKNDAGNIFFMALLLPALFAMLLLSIILPVALVSGSLNLSENTSTIYSIIAILSAQGGMFLVYFLYNKLTRVNPFKAGRISLKLKPLNIVLAVLIGAGTLLGLNNIITVFDSLFQKMGHTPQPMPLPLNNGWWLVLNLVLLAIVPAIVEELVFRGVIYNGLKQYGKKTAIIVSAILFSLIHGNIDQTVYPILFGIILAYIVYKTDNIVYSMIAHFINNAIVIIFNYIYTINPTLPQNNNPNQFLTTKFVLVAVAIAVATFVAIYFVGKLFKKNKEEKQVSILEEFPSLLEENNIELLNSAEQTRTLPEGVDRKVWEKIICQKNDLQALEKSSSTSNLMLWIGLATSILMWLLSI